MKQIKQEKSCLNLYVVIFGIINLLFKLDK